MKAALSDSSATTRLAWAAGRGIVSRSSRERCDGVQRVAGVREQSVLAWVHPLALVSLRPVQLQATTGVPDTAYVYVLDVFVSAAKSAASGESH